MTDLEKVQQAGYAIRYIDTPFIEVQSVADHQIGWAIRYIDTTSEAVRKTKQTNGTIT